MDRSFDQSQLAHPPWPHHPSCFFLRPINWLIDPLQLPINCSFASLLPLFFATDELLNQSIATGWSAAALPPFCSFFVQSIDGSKDRWQSANGRWHHHSSCFFFAANWLINQSIATGWLWPCHLPVLAILLSSHSWTSTGDSVASSAHNAKATAGFPVRKYPYQTCCDGILSTSTGTEPGLTSWDNSWVGEGKVLRRKSIRECMVVFWIWTTVFSRDCCVVFYRESNIRNYVII